MSQDQTSPTVSARKPRPRQTVTLPTGAQLGRFRVLTKLGSGGMGIVYVAHDPVLDRQVALKVLRPGAHGPLHAAEARARLLREAQAMARLSHPNVIAVHEVSSLDEEVFIVMELVDSGPVSQWLDDVPRSWEEILGVFLQAGEGLVAAHQAGLVHRDFKPDNVLMSSDGRVRVVDFGLVFSVADMPTMEAAAMEAVEASEVGYLGVPLTHTGAVLGTPPYMSPEQHRAQVTDERTDQFSFCVSLWEALYGARPFQGKRYRELIGNIFEGRVTEPSDHRDVPDSVERILRRGMSPAAADRFDSMRSLLDTLEAQLSDAEPGPAPHLRAEDGEPQPRVAANSGSVEERPRAGIRWSWVALALALAGAVVAVAVVGGGKKERSDQRAAEREPALVAPTAEPADAGIVARPVHEPAIDAATPAEPRVRTRRRRGSRKTTSADKRSPVEKTPPVAKTPVPVLEKPRPTKDDSAAARRRRELELGQ